MCVCVLGGGGGGGGGGVFGRYTLKGLDYLLSDKRWNLFKEINREEICTKGVARIRAFLNASTIDTISN